MLRKKNTSSDNEDTQLLDVFSAHFGDVLNFARIRLISMFVSALCKVKSVNFSKLSVGFDTKTKASSSFRRIQRFMADVHLPMEWTARFIFKLLPEKENLVLVMDRTNWKFGDSNINILMVGVSYRNIAFPLMFKMLDKRGNSNTQERIELIQNFIDWFGRDCIDCLLADREFVGQDWLSFLNTNKIRYHIRIRNNFKVYSPRKQREITVWHLFNNLKVGEIRHYEKMVKMHGEYCYISAMRTFQDEKNDYCIIVSYNKPIESLKYYSLRWQIETLFKGLKSSGFNLEDTHVTHLERIEKILSLVMMAFVWCYKVGDYIDREIKPITIKTHGRRAISIYKYGLDYISECLLSGFNKLNINIMKFLTCT